MELELILQDFPLNYILRYLDKIPHYFTIFLEDIFYYVTPNYS